MEKYTIYVNLGREKGLDWLGARRGEGEQIQPLGITGVRQLHYIIRIIMVFKSVLAEFHFEKNLLNIYYERS